MVTYGWPIRGYARSPPVIRVLQVLLVFVSQSQCGENPQRKHRSAVKRTAQMWADIAYKSAAFTCHRDKNPH